MSSIVKTEEGRARLVAWHERFRAQVPHPTESVQIKTDLGDTHVLVGGPQGAPDVVLLHGALASSAHVLRELHPLLRHFRVHAVDIPGVSVKSAEVRPSVASDAYGQWLGEVMSGLGLPRAHVIGVSWGGFVALKLAKVAPERIEKLALLVPAAVVKSPVWPGLWKIGLPMLRYRLRPSDASLRAAVKHLLTAPDEAWTSYLGEAFLSFDLDFRIPPLVTPEELSRLTAPTLVLGGDQDLSFPGAALVARAKVLFSNLAAAELIPDCRHCPPTTDDFRGWLSDRLLAFLAPQATPRLPSRPGEGVGSALA